MQASKRLNLCAAIGSLAALVAVSQPVNAQQNASTAGTATNAAKPNTTTNQAPQPQGGSTASRQTGSESPNAAVLVLMPVVQTSSEQLANGCWVRFYDNKNYGGRTLTLVGPIDMPNMDVPGAVWHDWDSAVVGPKARVTTYDNENYRDRTATLPAGAHVADLSDKKLGWFEEIHSARVSCAG